MIANIVGHFAQKRIGVVAESTCGNNLFEISFAGVFDRNIKW